MTQQYLEEIAPAVVKQRRITLSPAAEGNPAANRSFVVEVDYSKALPEGIVLPLILEIQGPSPASYVRREFLRTAPQSIVVTPKEGGDHMITLREAAHNRWFGSLGFTAEGTQLIR